MRYNSYMCDGGGRGTKVDYLGPTSPDLKFFERQALMVLPPWYIAWQNKLDESISTAEASQFLSKTYWNKPFYDSKFFVYKTKSQHLS